MHGLNALPSPVDWIERQRFFEGLHGSTFLLPGACGLEIRARSKPVPTRGLRLMRLCRNLIKNPLVLNPHYHRFVIRTPLITKPEVQSGSYNMSLNMTWYTSGFQNQKIR